MTNPDVSMHRVARDAKGTIVRLLVVGRGGSRDRTETLVDPAVRRAAEAFDASSRRACTDEEFAKADYALTRAVREFDERRARSGGVPDEEEEVLHAVEAEEDEEDFEGSAEGTRLNEVDHNFDDGWALSDEDQSP